MYSECDRIWGRFLDAGGRRAGALLQVVRDGEELRAGCGGRVCGPLGIDGGYGRVGERRRSRRRRTLEAR